MRTRAGILFPVLLAVMLMPFTASGKEAEKAKELTITSKAFGQGGVIPAKYTCDGGDVSPPITVRGVPAGARSLALIVDDPDAPGRTWVHWVAWNIPPDIGEIGEARVPAGAVQGVNDFRRNSYGGPCPPSGTHRYLFKVYALDITLPISPAGTKATLEKAMQGHILAQGRLMGTYQRR